MKEYFPHDYNARTDPKLQNVMMHLKVAGIGIYWCIIEQLYEQGGKIPLSDIKAIAFYLRVKQDVVSRLINDYGLFEKDDEYFWSESVLNRCQKREEISKARSIAGQKGNEARWGTQNEDDFIENESQKIAKNRKRIANASQANRKKSQIKENNNIYKYNIIPEEDKENILLTEDIKEREEIEAFQPLSDETSDASAEDPQIDIKGFVNFFNQEISSKNTIIPKVTALSDYRKAALKARAREYGKEALSQAVKKAASSDFLNGKNNRGFRATFDWIFKPNNFPKILEGNFDNSSFTTHNGYSNGNNGNGNGGNGRGNKRSYNDVSATCPEDYTDSAF